MVCTGGAEPVAGGEGSESEGRVLMQKGRGLERRGGASAALGSRMGSEGSVLGV